MDNNTADNNQVAYVDIDATDSHGTQTVLASMYITREQFNYANSYQGFSLPFYLSSTYLGQTIQFRVLWLGPSYVKEKSLDYDTETVWSQTFGYDAFGNLSKNGSVSFQAGYLKSDGTTNNRIQSLPGFTPAYDANGNTTADSLHSYAWDAEGHAITIGTIGLSYDALGRMVEQYNGSSYTQILYGPTGKLALMNGQSVTKAFIPLPAGATAVYTSGPTLSYFRHPDWLGTSRFASTASRTRYYSGAYAPFGETYSEAGTTDRSFTGQNQDTVPGSTAGLYDFMFREYAQYGRWISPDPAGLGAVNPANPQSWNRYGYVTNNPLSLLDPLGLYGGPCADGGPISLCGFWDDFGPMAGRCLSISVDGSPTGQTTCGNRPVGGGTGPGGGPIAPIAAKNCTPGTKGCFNVPTQLQAMMKCVDDFHATKVGWVAGNGSLLSLIPGYSGNYLIDLAEWTVLPATKIAAGKMLSEDSAIITSKEIAEATLPEWAAGKIMTFFENVVPPAIALATGMDAAVGQGCAMMNDPNLMQAVETYY